jgi:predicted transcriptional regulator
MKKKIVDLFFNTTNIKVLNAILSSTEPKKNKEVDVMSIEKITKMHRTYLYSILNSFKDCGIIEMITKKKHIISFTPEGRKFAQYLYDLVGKISLEKKKGKKL